LHNTQLQKFPHDYDMHFLQD